LSNIFRHKRRSLSAIVGIVLVITLISGVNISIDTISNSMLDSMLDLVPVDFTVGTDNESYNETLEALKIDDVVWTEVITNTGIATIGRWDTGNNTTTALVGIRPDAEDYFLNIIQAHDNLIRDVIGDFNISQGGILLQEHQAESLDVDVGDMIYLESTTSWFNGTGFQNETFYHNMTVSGIIDIERSESFQLFGVGDGGETEYRHKVAFVHIEDRYTIIEELNLTISGYGTLDSSEGFNFLKSFGTDYLFYVWTDRDRLIVLGDLEKTKGNYVVLGRNLKNSLLNIGLSQNDFTIEPAPVILIIEAFDLILLLFRLLVLVVSIPVIVLGLYLSLILTEVGMTRRRRELGIMKTRGATSGQLFGLLLTESMMLGIIAGVIGIVLGVLVSKLFLLVTPLATYFVEDIYGFYISFESIIVGMVFAIILIMIASYRPAKRITSLPGVEMLQTRTEGEVKLPYRPTLDFIFIGIALFTFVLMFIVENVTFGSFFAFLCILDLVLIVLTPLSSFFFIVGLTRLLTRGTTKIYDKASRAVKFMTKDLWHIVNRNIVRNPRRTSNVCLLIAIGLAFGMIVSTVMESQYKYEERVIIGRIGGDLVVGVTYDTNFSFADKISAVDGVELLTPVVSLYSTTGEIITAFNASAYYTIVQPEQYYFSEGDAKQSIEELETEGNVIINTFLEKNQYLRIGDEYSTGIRYPYPAMVPEFYDFNIVGIVKVMPGAGQEVLPIYVTTPQIYTDLDTLNVSAISNGSVSLKFLVKVSDGHDPSAVAEEIDAISPSVTRVLVLEDELQTLQENPIEGAVYNFLLLIYFFAILILAFGLGLLVYIAAVEREHELAGFMARGASTKQVSSLLLGEGFTIMIVGVIVGVITGLIAAFMINELISFLISGTIGYMGLEVAIERAFVISWQTLALILITIISLIIAGLIATLRVKRIDVAKALRERGG